MEDVPDQFVPDSIDWLQKMSCVWIPTDLWRGSRAFDGLKMFGLSQVNPLVTLVYNHLPKKEIEHKMM